MARGQNLFEDPIAQEKIRRDGPHEFRMVEGPRGPMMSYVPLPAYQHQEYPKVMDKTPRPDWNEFKNRRDLGKDPTVAYDEAVQEWDGKIAASVVNSKAEEEAWFKAHVPLAEHKGGKKAA